MTYRPTETPRSRLLLIRGAFAALALVAAVAMILQWVPSSAVAGSDSSLTVAWVGDASAAKSYQPVRDPASPHYPQMKNISVTVNQTKNLIDQAVRVKVSGFAATKSGVNYLGGQVANAANFVQAMQCWGDPAAKDFAQTCQWGGLFGSNSGLGNLVESDVTLRVASTNLFPPPQGTDPATDPRDVPFRSVDGAVYSGRQAVTGSGASAVTGYPLFSLFGPTNTNEVVGARINADGSGVFDFETLNADSAPQLGCGANGRLRCWLVVVPRDNVWGGNQPGRKGDCSALLDSQFAAPAYGSTGTPQAGSPVNPACDYWDNRIVVPLDFTPTGVTCPAGATERRTVGSDLLVSAMASWQPKLCADVKSNYNFSSSPDILSRSQLVQGKVGLAFTSGPLVASEFSEPDAATLTSTTISYSPVAATSAVFAFTADGRSGRITSLRLTPRLVAKLLTQSYVFTVPVEATNPQADIAQLPAQNRSYRYWNQDPDFRAANPNWQEFLSNPAVLLPGPYAGDVIAQLWKWVTSDAEARAWLNGAPDPYGMSINPYYRAAGDPLAVVPTFDAKGNPVTQGGAPVTKAVGLTNLDGSPLKLGDSSLNSFLKADATLVPFDVSGVRYPFGSIQAQPYSQDFLSATRAAFRANPGAKTSWDPTVIDDAGQTGAWVSSGPQIVGQRFTLAFTDAASAARYGLGTASLALDNKPTVFTDPTDVQVTAAMTSTALQPTSVSSVSRIDPSKVAEGQYPLTSLVYASVNLTASDAPARADFAKLIRQVTTSGQVPGTAVGQLPVGYVPLTQSLVSQAASAATAIESYVAPTASPTDAGGGGYAMDGGGNFGVPGSGSQGAGGSTVPGSDGTKGSITAKKSAYIGRTPRADTPWGMQVVLMTGLIGGVLGSLLTPLFFRRRRIG